MMPMISMYLLEQLGKLFAVYFSLPLFVVCCPTGHAGTRCFFTQLLYSSLCRAEGSQSSRASNELCKNSGELPEDYGAIESLQYSPMH